MRAQEQRNHQTNKRLVIGAVLSIFVTVISGVLLNWLHLFGP
jgi:heme/copper-type cytochrome/quinol oxidase subunit 4